MKNKETKQISLNSKEQKTVKFKIQSNKTYKVTLQAEQELNRLPLDDEVFFQS